MDCNFQKPFVDCVRFLWALDPEIESKGKTGTR